MDRLLAFVPLAFAALLLRPVAVSGADISLVELFELGRITMKVTGTGVYEGQSVRVEVGNSTNQPFRTSIPLGWRFVSERGPVQDLIVVREEVIALSGHGRTTVLCRAFCCEASGEGPEEGEAYKRGGMASAAMIAAARAVAAGDYDDDLAQHAMWTISDAHDIASMGALQGTVDDTLRMAISRISGQPPPLYSMFFLEEEGVVCSGRPAFVGRNLMLDLPAGAEVTVVVIDRDGAIVAMLHDHERFDPGTHTLSLGVDVVDWPSGRYAFRAHTSDRSGVHRLPFVL